MKMKRILSFLLSLSFLLGLSACDCEREYMNKQEIFGLVTENEALLSKCVETSEFSEVLALDHRITVSVGKTYIDFYCGGKGLSVSGCDYGFYYSEEEIALAVHSWASGELLPQGEGYVQNGNNNYYTERIFKNFYYYESGF